MDQHAALRACLAKTLDWQEAHAGFEKVVEAWPPKLRGTRLEGLPYSAWQLIEHMRLTQHDILEFCRNPISRTAMCMGDGDHEDRDASM